MNDTRSRLIAATIELIRAQGLAAVSARSVGRVAEANQALVFYHFGTLGSLIESAYDAAVLEATATYADELAAATGVGDLLAIAQRIRAAEQGRGNVQLMAQLLAGAQHDTALQAVAERSVEVWAAAVEPAVRRTLAEGVLQDLVDPEALTRLVCSALIGFELYNGVDPERADGAFGALADLAALAEVIDDLPAPAVRAVRSGLRRRLSRR
ncbi:TetR/AcrR family transcriptional regulator [Calidifontibacter terrae]